MRLLPPSWLRYARNELPQLVTLGGIAAALLVFVHLASEVLEGDTEAFDRRFNALLRDPSDPTLPIGPPWLRAMALDFTSLGSTGVLALLTIVVVTFLLLVRKRAAAATVIVAVAGGTLLSQLLKHVYERPRPPSLPIGYYVDAGSFPSGHATMSAVVYLTLGVLLARVQPRQRVKVFLTSVAILLTLVVGCSRVYLGVHWPTDVIAGWLVGSAWAVLCWMAMERLQSKGAVETDARTVEPE